VIGGMPVAPNRVYSRRNSYHQRYGAAPERGRHEIEPPPDRQLPEQAETFSRGWGTPPKHPMTHYPPPGDHPASGPSLPFNVGGDVVPPTIVDPQTFSQPPVVVVPRRRP
jgi:hypothetical protein